LQTDTQNLQWLPSVLHPRHQSKSSTMLSMKAICALTPSSLDFISYVFMQNVSLTASNLQQELATKNQTKLTDTKVLSSLVLN